MKSLTVTAEELRAILEYDPATGAWTNRVHRGQRAVAGSPAGAWDRRDGYLRISIDQIKYLAHRLAWLYMTGEWPAQLIDHENTDRGDNRWANLRQATHAINSQNLHRARKDNKSGTLGVVRQRSTHRWCAQIRHDGKMVRLGLFDDKQAAHAAYVAAKRRLHEGCTL